MAPFSSFRVAIGSRAGASFGRLMALKGDFDSVRAMRSESLDGENPVEALEAIADQSTDGLVAQSLKSIASKFSAEMRLRNEIESRSAKTAIVSATMLIRSYRDTMREFEAKSAFYDLNPDGMDALKKDIALLEVESKITGDTYLAVLKQISDDFSLETLSDALMQAKSDLTYEHSDKAHSMADRLFDQLSRYKETSEFEPKEILSELRLPL